MTKPKPAPKPKPKLTPAKARMAEAAERAKALDEAFKRDAEQVEELLAKDPNTFVAKDFLFLVEHARAERTKWELKETKRVAKKEDKADED